MLEDLFARYAGELAALGFAPDRAPAAAALLRDFQAANAVHNLVADADDDVLFHAHFLDSLQPLKDPAAARADARVIDVGSGGGFPGLPMLLARPSWRGVLLDSVRKKMDAVGEISRKHLAGRGEALWGRAELLAREAAHRHGYDLAFCRAVGRFTTVLELTLPFLKTGGSLLAHRGHETPEEAAAAEEALETLAGRVESLTPYALPGLDKTRYIVRIVKTGPTPAAYPRREGVPAKRPL